MQEVQGTKLNYDALIKFLSDQKLQITCLTQDSITSQIQLVKLTGL